jgi:hypothetical protein
MTYTFSQDALDLNPGLLKPASKQKPFKAVRSASKLEAKFDQLWAVL